MEKREKNIHLEFDLMCAQFVRPYDFHPMKKKNPFEKSDSPNFETNIERK